MPALSPPAIDATWCPRKRADPQAASPLVARRRRPSGENYLDTAVLRLAHAIGGRDQRLGLALANDRDRRRRHAVTHQSVLDRIRTAQRQRHIVVLRA